MRTYTLAEPPGHKKARARQRVFAFCQQLEPWLRDDSSTGGYEDNMYGGGRGSASGHYYDGYQQSGSSSSSSSSSGDVCGNDLPMYGSLARYPAATSMFVHPASSSLAAAASVSSSWSNAGWRAPIGAMSGFDNDMNNIQPLEPLTELNTKLPHDLQMRELIQRVQVRKKKEERSKKNERSKKGSVYFVFLFLPVHSRLFIFFFLFCLLFSLSKKGASMCDAKSMCLFRFGGYCDCVHY